MSIVAPTVATWTWPPDVKELAAELGVTAYLQPVYEMTRRVYAGSRIIVSIDVDPEVEGDRHILFEADVTGWNVQQMVEAQNRWASGIFDCCPATQAWVFRVGMIDAP